MSDCPSAETVVEDLYGAVFLILEDDAVIAADIEGSLRSAGECRVIRVSHQRDIAPSLMDEARITAAILGIPYASVVESGVHHDLASRGARIVLTVGEEDEAQVRKCGWGMLVRPFTDQMILHAIRGSAER